MKWVNLLSASNNKNHQQGLNYDLNSNLTVKIDNVIQQRETSGRITTTIKVLLMNTIVMACH